MYGKVKVVVPEGVYVLPEGYCGDGVTEYWINSCEVNKFDKKEPRVYWTPKDKVMPCGDVLIYEKLCELVEINTAIGNINSYFSTGQCVTEEGPYCGMEVVACMDSTGTQTMYIFDSATKAMIVLPEGTACGFCTDELLLGQFEIESISIQYCATEDSQVTPEDLIALINDSGETFNNSGTAIDLSNPNQEIISASVQTYFMDSIVKKPDGSEFTVFADSACVESKSGLVIQQLYQGGKYLIGDTQADGSSNNIVIDETVIWPCGTAGVYCFSVKNKLSDNK